MNTTQLHLVIPGLFGPMPDFHKAESSLPTLESLRRFFAVSQYTPLKQQSYNAFISALFSQPEAIAQATALADGVNSVGKAYVLRADPVHLQADIDKALLLDQLHIQTTKREAEALIASFNAHFMDLGVVLKTKGASRWYLFSDDPFAIQTHALPDVISRNVNHFLPEGEKAAYWRRQLNEAQMLFFSHDVNQQREERGQRSINSIWLWGEGRLSAKQSIAYQQVYSDETLAKGLAMHSQVEHSALPDDGKDYLDNYASDSQTLMVLDDLLSPTLYLDSYEWLNHLEMLNEQWLEPLYEALRKKQLQGLKITVPGVAEFYAEPLHFLQFWRRGKAFSHYVQTNV